MRSGLDVMRMLALGAHGVFLGRAWVYALAAHGADSKETNIANVFRHVSPDLPP